MPSPWVAVLSEPEGTWILAFQNGHHMPLKSSIMFSILNNGEASAAVTFRRSKP